jgi:hypothetical protein
VPIDAPLEATTARGPGPEEHAAASNAAVTKAATSRILFIG